MKRLILIAVALIVVSVPIASFSTVASGLCIIVGLVLFIVAVVRGIANRGKTKYMFIFVNNLDRYMQNIYSLSYYNSEYGSIRSASDSYEGFKTYSNTFNMESIRLNFEPGDDGTYIVQINGDPIGTIPADKAKAALALERRKKIKSMSVKITGGEYKTVDGGRLVQDYDPYTARIEIEHKL